jgi:hypothetical protein
MPWRFVNPDHRGVLVRRRRDSVRALGTAKVIRSPDNHILGRQGAGRLCSALNVRESCGSNFRDKPCILYTFGVHVAIIARMSCHFRGLAVGGHDDCFLIVDRVGQDFVVGVRAHTGEVSTVYLMDVDIEKLVKFLSEKAELTG